MVKKKRKTIESIREEVKNRAKKVSKSPAAKKVKEVSKDVEKTLDKLIEEGEKSIEKTVEIVKKKTINTDVFIEYPGNKVEVKNLKEKAYNLVKEKMDIKDVKSLKLYFKVEENKVYCIVNDSESLDFNL